MDLKKVKMFAYPIIYWVVFIIIPYRLAKFYVNSSLDISGYLLLYLLFIAPFLYFIPYKISNLNSKRERLYFCFIGLIIPYIIIYIYIGYNYFHMFDNFKLL